MLCMCVYRTQTGDGLQMECFQRTDPGISKQENNSILWGHKLDCDHTKTEKEICP